MTELFESIRKNKRIHSKLYCSNNNKLQLNILMIEKTTRQKEWDVWLEEQIKYLRLREFEKLDLANVVEELEDLGKEQRNACKSFCRQHRDLRLPTSRRRASSVKL